MKRRIETRELKSRKRGPQEEREKHSGVEREKEEELRWKIATY